MQYTYLGSTPVTEVMWQELMEEAINTTTSNIVMTGEYKQKIHENLETLNRWDLNFFFTHFVRILSTAMVQ